MNEQGKATRSIRRFVGVLVCVAAVVALAPAAGALPSGDPYEDIDVGEPYPLPDLVVSVRYESVTHWSTGSWLGYQAILTVKNVGNKRAGASSVTARSEERNEQGYYMVRALTQSIPGLDPGKSFTVESLYFRKPCWVRFVAIADSAKAVQESNENNNVTHRDISRCNSW